ncbi:helix-turn-helix domain-containing protein [Brevibacillus borstelensis]|uniref:IS66 family insertion sequence element accessory protein TnpA n=1 Tax=Brevibacillus borstelensis TaxID=45462 RepID=UPI00203E5DC7|nr:helix-turn-helix domain-containing protein [Brevibacillus borstelensis]MCM3625123.1 helix-turn-helix domain-containing protein [Brevibacillus borstelensis]
MTEEERREVWIARIQDYRSSGEQAATWCERHGVTPRQLWYWMKKLQPAEKQKQAIRQPKWIPVHLDETSHDGSSSLLVKVGSATIEVRPGFDPSLLADVVRVLKALC